MKSEKISRRATVRFETPPGDQAQFDWSEYIMEIGAKLTKVYCYSMILSFSRKKAVLFSKSIDSDSILSGIHELFMKLGGVTLELVIDNPKTLVIHNRGDEEVKFNDDALMLFGYLGVIPNACHPYRPRTKGKIEKPFQYIENHFVKGNSFGDMNELNDAADKFIKKWNSKVNGTTKRIPNELFEEEKPHLSIVKCKKILKDTLKIRKVSLDSFVSVGGIKYSVPVKYADKNVKIRVLYGYILEIYDYALNIIKVWYIAKGSYRGICKDDCDYDEIAPKLPTSIPEIRRVFESTFESGKEYLEICQNTVRQPHYHAREFLKLKELYSTEDLNSILTDCIDKKILKISDIQAYIKENYNTAGADKSGFDYSSKSSADSDKLIRDLSYYSD